MTRRSTASRRLLAASLDLAIFVPFAALASWALIEGYAEERSEPGNFAVFGLIIGLSLVAALVLVGWAIYDLSMTATRGQTLGKRVVGIRIAPLSRDGPPGWRVAMVREGFRAVTIGLLSPICVGTIIVVSAVIDGDGVLDILGDQWGWFVVPLWLPFVIDVALIAGPSHRGLHDRIGRTEVIRAESTERV